ncbi:MAG: hypothetical protein IT362_10510 [Deltaproteobacteria bacterium]|nr:hypothetical protein [Deltaproteobacteria bacterium]
MSRKFNSSDREQVRAFYEKTAGKQLTPTVGKNCFVDQDGRRYCLLGALGHFHAIDKRIIPGDTGWIDGVLIIAIREIRNIDIFEGPINILLRNLNALSDSGNQYQFTSRLDGDRLFINKVQDFFLEKKGSAEAIRKLSEADRMLIEYFSIFGVKNHQN